MSKVKVVFTDLLHLTHFCEAEIYHFVVSVISVIYTMKFDVKGDPNPSAVRGPSGRAR